MKLVPGGEPFFFRGGPVGALLVHGFTGALLVHGFTGAPREVRPLGEALRGAGCAALGVRLTHHATWIEDMFRSRWHDWYASVLDGYHLLMDQCEAIFVLGLSMGGALSLLLASERPVAGVVALSTPSRPRLNRMDWRTRYARLFSLLVPTVNKGPADPDADPGHVHYPRYPVRAIGELRALLEAVDRRLSSITAPALIIQSRRDTSVAPANGQYLFDRLGSADKDLLWLERSGHIITEGPERDLVSQAAVKFVLARGAAALA